MTRKQTEAFLALQHRQFFQAIVAGLVEQFAEQREALYPEDRADFERIILQAEHTATSIRRPVGQRLRLQLMAQYQAFYELREL